MSYIDCTVYLPGVMQFESNLSSFGSSWPFIWAFLILFSASLAVLKSIKEIIDS